MRRLYDERARAVCEIVKTRFANVIVDFAEQVGVAPSTVSRWITEKKRKNIGEESARQIEIALSLDRYALDGDPDAGTKWHLPLTQDEIRIGHAWGRLDEKRRSAIEAFLESGERPAVRRSTREELQRSSGSSTARRKRMSNP